MGQGFTHVYRVKFPWMEKFIGKPRESCGIESLDQPIDHISDPRYATAAGMIGQPDIGRPIEPDIEGYHLPTQCRSAAWEDADAGAIGDRPIIGAEHIGLHDQEIALGAPGKQPFEDLPGGALMDHQPMLDEFVRRFRRAEAIEIFLAREQHLMQPSELDDLDVERGGAFEIDGDLGLMPRHVGGTHRALQVDQDVRERLLKFHQARRKPEDAEALADGDPDLARQRVAGRDAGAQQIEGRRLHAFDGGDDHGAFVGQVRAVHVAHKQRGAGLLLEIVDAAADGIDRQAKALGGGAEAAGTRDFEKDAGSVPIGKTAAGQLLAFLLGNAPVCWQMHTKPFRVLNLAESRADHNLDGLAACGFAPNSCRGDGIRGWVNWGPQGMSAGKSWIFISFKSAWGLRVSRYGRQRVCEAASTPTDGSNGKRGL